MTSFCNTQSITPGNNSAPLSIGIQGGTAPYKVYNNETNFLLSSPTSPSDNIVINSQAPEGMQQHQEDCPACACSSHVTA